MQYVLAHTHGIGDVDFSTMSPDQLTTVNNMARKCATLIAPSIFLIRSGIASCENLLKHYWANRAGLSNIIGFSIEGPLLGHEGGVPSNSIWAPNAAEWRRIAQMGRNGLRYVVVSPDRSALGGQSNGVLFKDVVDMLYENGVKVALGHFRRDNPKLSAERTSILIDYIVGQSSRQKGLILADHLYNDMPRSFVHAWRTPSDRLKRSAQIAAILSADWTHCNLDELLGPVPSMLLKSAREEKILPFLNFDGMHVDLEICKKTVCYAGTDNIVGITDDTSVSRLAGIELRRESTGQLWVHSDGVIAAGTTGLSGQLSNMTKLGFDEPTKLKIFGKNGAAAIAPLTENHSNKPLYAPNSAYSADG